MYVWLSRCSFAIVLVILLVVSTQISYSEGSPGKCGLIFSANKGYCVSRFLRKFLNINVPWCVNVNGSPGVCVYYTKSKCCRCVGEPRPHEYNDFSISTP